MKNTTSRNTKQARHDQDIERYAIARDFCLAQAASENEHLRTSLVIGGPGERLEVKRTNTDRLKNVYCLHVYRVKQPVLVVEPGTHGLRRIVWLFAVGNIQASVLYWLKQQNIALYVLDGDGHYIMRTEDDYLNSTYNDLQIALTYEQECWYACRIVEQKVASHVKLLKKYKQLIKPEHLERAIQTEAWMLQQFEQADSAYTFSKERIRSAEGQNADRYFDCMFDITINWQESGVVNYWRSYPYRIEDDHKDQRGALHPINAMRNFAFKALAKRIKRYMQEHGLIVNRAFLHSRSNKDINTRDSLTWDLIEPLRAKVEEAILELTQQYTLSEDYFKTDEHTGLVSLAWYFAKWFSAWVDRAVPDKAIREVVDAYIAYIKKPADVEAHPVKHAMNKQGRILKRAI